MGDEALVEKVKPTNMMTATIAIGTTSPMIVVRCL